MSGFGFGSQHEKVRAQHTCVGCNGPKATGLLLCWPCHRKQKRLNAGQLYDYSPEIEAKLDKLEEWLVQTGTRGKVCT